MNISKWMMAELSPQEQKKMERLIDPARQIAMIGIFLGVFVLLVGIVCCIDLSIETDSFAWHALLIGAAGGLFGYIVFLCCRMYIHKIFQMICIERAAKSQN